MSTSGFLGGSDSLAFKTFNVVFLGIPGYLDKMFTPQPQIQRLGDISAQTAKEGVPRLIVWGRVRPVGGNLIYVQKPIVRKVKQKAGAGGGKGGKPADVYVEKVYRTYAIRICEGPATGIIRVWRNNKLVFDARGNAWGAKNNPVFKKRARFYLGGWGQMPDPTLQSIWGAENVTAHRGTCYMVIISEDLTDLGGSVPQYLFEVERAEGIAVTSRPYTVEDADSAGCEPGAQQLFLKDQIITLPGLTDAAAALPGCTLLSLEETSAKASDYSAVVPGVFRLSVPPEARGGDSFAAVAPAVTRLSPSITYDRQAFEGTAVSPACTELTLT